MPRPDGPSRKATTSATSDGLEQPLDRLPLEDHVLEHALLRQPVRRGLGGDLRLDERRAHVGRADGGGADPDRRPFERQRLHEPEHAVLRRDVAGLERRRGQRVRGGDHADPPVACRRRAPPTRTSRAGTGEVSSSASSRSHCSSGKSRDRRDVLEARVRDDRVEPAVRGRARRRRPAGCRRASSGRRRRRRPRAPSSRPPRAARRSRRRSRRARR